MSKYKKLIYNETPNQSAKSKKIRELFNLEEKNLPVKHKIRIIYNENVYFQAEKQNREQISKIISNVINNSSSRITF